MTEPFRPFCRQAHPGAPIELGIYDGGKFRLCIVDPAHAISLGLKLAMLGHQSRPAPHAELAPQWRPPRDMDEDGA